jgi:hypothetical protein
MHLRWKIVLGICLASLLAAVLYYRSANSARLAAEDTRRDLKRKGFKLALSEFNFDSSPEIRARSAEITNAARLSHGFIRRELFAVLRPFATNAMLPLFQEEQITTEFSDDLWTDLHEVMEENADVLNRACTAALGERIFFQPLVMRDNDRFFGHLTDMRALALALSGRTLVRLKEQQRSEAWKNLLALTHLVARWDPGPAELPQMVRMTCLSLAQQTTWEALQFGGWGERDLATLQHEWEKTDFFARLPDSASFARAHVLFACEREREQPLRMNMPISRVVSEMLDSPARAWSDFTSGARDENYRQNTIFADERTLALYFTNLELLYGQIAGDRNWLELQSIPGLTNMPGAPQFTERQLALVNDNSRNGYFQRSSVAVRAAEAEARKRVLVTALALERYKTARGEYPASLAALTPALLPTAATDFIDGQPLRYRKTDDGHFLCYSIGLDGVDDGGQMMDWLNPTQEAGPGFRPRREPDLAWARPGTAEEIGAFKEVLKGTRMAFRRRYGLTERTATNAPVK